MTGKPTARLLAPLSLLLLAGCVQPQTLRPQISAQMTAAEAQKEREIAFKLIFDRETRLDRVSSRVLVGAAPLCHDKVVPYLGAWIANSDSYPLPQRAAAGSVLGLSHALKVVYVVPDLPAAKAGLQVGDMILTLNGQRVAEGQDAVSKFGKQVKALPTGQPFDLAVLRGGVEQDFKFAAVPGCNYAVLLKDDDTINAFADGKAIFVTKGMMRFTRNDEELALVVGHELGHDVMGHIAAQRANAAGGEIAGALIDILFAAGGVNTQGGFSKMGGNIGANAYSQDFESEADYVGLYFMARAGYKIDDAPNFWRRMGAENPGSIAMASSHPPTAQRFLALEKTVAEIHAKEAAGKPLVPELKPKPATPPGQDDRMKPGPVQ